MISIAIRTIATHDSNPRKIVAETRNILPDVLSFPFTGGSLCTFEVITDVGDNIIVGVGVGLVMVVVTGVGVGVSILGVGLGCRVEIVVGRVVGVGCGIQLQVTVVGNNPPPP